MEAIILALVAGVLIGVGWAYYRNRSEAPTSRQIVMIAQLREERDVRSLTFGKPETRAEASRIIDVLLECPLRNLPDQLGEGNDT